MRTDVDVATNASSFFLDLCQIRALVPVGLGIVIVRDGVEAWGFRGSAGDDGIRHTDDGRGIHATAEFGKDRAVRMKPAPDGLREDHTEVLFIFSIGAVADHPARIEIPVFSDRVLPIPYEYQFGRRDGMRPHVRSQVSRREK